jgi:hypothetical protein
LPVLRSYWVPSRGVSIAGPWAPATICMCKGWDAMTGRGRAWVAGCGGGGVCVEGAEVWRGGVRELGWLSHFATKWAGGKQLHGWQLRVGGAAMWGCVPKRPLSILPPPPRLGAGQVESSPLIPHRESLHLYYESETTCLSRSPSACTCACGGLYNLAGLSK